MPQITTNDPNNPYNVVERGERRNVFVIGDDWSTTYDTEAEAKSNRDKQKIKAKDASGNPTSEPAPITMLSKGTVLVNNGETWTVVYKSAASDADVMSVIGDKPAIPEVNRTQKEKWDRRSPPSGVWRKIVAGRIMEYNPQTGDYDIDRGASGTTSESNKWVPEGRQRPDGSWDNSRPIMARINPETGKKETREPDAKELRDWMDAQERQADPEGLTRAEREKRDRERAAEARAQNAETRAASADERAAAAANRGATQIKPDGKGGLVAITISPDGQTATVTPIEGVRETQSVTLNGRLYEKQPDGTYKDVTPAGRALPKEVKPFTPDKGKFGWGLAERRNELMQLLQAGVIDQQQFLEIFKGDQELATMFSNHDAATRQEEIQRAQEERAQAQEGRNAAQDQRAAQTSAEASARGRRTDAQSMMTTAQQLATPFQGKVAPIGGRSAYGDALEGQINLGQAMGGYQEMPVFAKGAVGPGGPGTGVRVAAPAAQAAPPNWQPVRGADGVVRGADGTPYTPGAPTTGVNHLGPWFTPAGDPNRTAAAGAANDARAEAGGAPVSGGQPGDTPGFGPVAPDAPHVPYQPLPDEPGFDPNGTEPVGMDRTPAFAQGAMNDPVQYLIARGYPPEVAREVARRRQMAASGFAA